MTTDSVALTSTDDSGTMANRAHSQEERRQAAYKAFQAALPPGDSRALCISSLDRTGIPVWVVSYRGEDGYINDGIGYGATEAEALCGAFGELIETSMNHAAMRSLPSISQTTYRQLIKKEGSEHVADPRMLCLEAGTREPLTRPLDWVPARALNDERIVWVPREFVANSSQQLLQKRSLITPITNGTGAGLSREQALGHAVMELLQRDGNCTAFRALDRGVFIQLDEVHDVGVTELLKLAERCGIRVLAKLARTEFGFVNVYVVGEDIESNPWFSLQTTACGEASHPARESAIRKALLEFFSARSRKAFMHGPLDRIAKVSGPEYIDDYLRHFDLSEEEPRALRTMCDWLGRATDDLRHALDSTVFSRVKSVPLSALPTVDQTLTINSVSRLGILRERLAEAGLEILFVDLGNDKAKKQGVHAVRAIVPGLECETMSYGRIGYRGVCRAVEEDLDFVHVGERPTGSLSIAMTEAQIEMLGGLAWLDRARVDEIVGSLYPLYREPRSHAAQLALAQSGQ